MEILPDEAKLEDYDHLHRDYLRWRRRANTWRRRAHIVVLVAIVFAVCCGFFLAGVLNAI